MAKAQSVVIGKKTGIKKRFIPAPATRKRLQKSATAAVSKAHEQDKEVKILSKVEQEAQDGLKVLKAIVSESVPPDGLSPLGHKLKAQNGQLDIALLSASGFDDWILHVCEAGCQTRRSELKDNKTFVLRLQSHLKFLSGAKSSGKVGMPKDLEKVQLGHRAKEIMEALVPVSRMFDAYVAVGKF